MSLTCLTCVCGERCPRRGRRAKGQPAGRAGQGGKHCGRRVTFVVCPCAVWWWWCRVVVVQGSFGRAGAGLAALSALALCTLGLLGFFTSKCVPFRCSRPQMPSPAPSPFCAVAFLRPQLRPHHRASPACASIANQCALGLALSAKCASVARWRSELGVDPSVS